MTGQQDFMMNYLKFFFKNLLKSYSDQYEHIKSQDLEVTSEKFAQLYLSENPITNSFSLMKKTNELKAWFETKIKTNDS